MKILQNKKILFFCYPFRKYNLHIIDELKKMGADVTYFSDSPDYMLFRKSPSSIKKIIINLYNKHLLNEIREKRFDFVFVIKGEYLSNIFLEKIRLLNPDSKFILYLWDSSTNYNYSDKLVCFDQKLSFDRLDCEKYKDLTYLPLFYIDTFKKKKTYNLIYDLFSIGGGVYYRKPILKNLIANLNNPDIKCMFYLLSKKDFILGFLKKEKYFRYLFLPISHNKFIEKLFESTAIVDIQHEKQAGLTMRTIEVLASGKKLITTNNHIKEESFYNENNICVINRENPIIPANFLKRKMTPVDMSNYTLHSFLTNIFSFPEE
ncbi:MAG: hypothetical protein CVU05_00225 [Bacteroidetes bacterium HGW-Bacteroidetes-21]|jgi:hypothetical protein|nr:MAG: hypothetical protein CVU05_00225 [Bacteroidetes bacterium HGW-Bacteroidetes-21]